MLNRVLCLTAIFTFLMPAQKPAGTVAVRVKTDAPGAEVTIDGKRAGRTPLVLPPLADGKYVLTFAKAGFDEHTETLDLRGGKPTSVFVVLKPKRPPLPALPIKYPVVHLHVKDACYGSLTIGESGVEFKALTGPDVFAIPVKTIRTVISRQAAAYLHPGPIGPIEVPGGHPSSIASVHLETKSRKFTFLVVDESFKEVDAVRTREFYDVIYRLWDSTSRK